MDMMERDSFAYINRAYGLSVKKGDRVEYTGDGTPRGGEIVSADGGYLRIRLDGDVHSGRYHPTWALRHLSTPSLENKGDAS